MLLLEPFKNTLPENVAVFIMERNVQNAEAAHVLADVLTHRDVKKKKSHCRHSNSTVESVPMETRSFLPSNVKVRLTKVINVFIV